MAATKHLAPYQFKKGESGNPNGARAYHNRRKAALEVSSESLARISAILFDGTLEDLKILSEDNSVTPMEKLCIGVVIRAWEKGDAQALGMLLDRFIGKPKETHVIETKNQEFDATKLSDDELARRAELLDKASE